MSDPAHASDFRRWMGRWATGVSIVTAREEGRDHGLTVNAFLSVSLDPPTVLVSLGEEANTTPLVLRSGRFVVNVLRVDQEPLSRRFAQVGTVDTKFEGVPLHRDGNGLALLDGTLGALSCQVMEAHRVHDHHLIVGHVVAIETGPEGLPLLFYRGRYGQPEGSGSVRLPPPH